MAFLRRASAGQSVLGAYDFIARAVVRIAIVAFDLFDGDVDRFGGFHVRRVCGAHSDTKFVNNCSPQGWLFVPGAYAPDLGLECFPVV